MRFWILICWLFFFLFRSISNLLFFLEFRIACVPWSLSGEDLLDKGMATHSSILAWRIPWTEEPGGLQSMGLQRVGHDWVTNIHTHTYSLSTVQKWESLFWKEHPRVWLDNLSIGRLSMIHYGVNQPFQQKLGAKMALYQQRYGQCRPMGTETGRTKGLFFLRLNWFLIEE